MLLANKRLASRYDGVQCVCISQAGDEVFCVTDPEHDCPPASRCKNPVQLLSSDDWLTVTKKYRLSNKAIRKLKKFWVMGEAEFLTDSPREQWAFHALEDIMLKKMKRFHKAKRGVKYIPFHAASPENNGVTT